MSQLKLKNLRGSVLVTNVRIETFWRLFQVSYLLNTEHVSINLRNCNPEVIYESFAAIHLGEKLSIIWAFK